MSNSRTSKSVKNISIALLMQMLSLVLMFGSRKIFIVVLGNDYLSITGLFSNILTLLSFAELGIGSAITYSLYKPLADNNQEAISAIMNTLRKAQTAIAVIMFILGLAVIPFMTFLVNGVPDVLENITFIYILFLINTSVSYLFSHPRVILAADQKNYVVSLSKVMVLFISVLIQAAVLLITRNYMLYLLVQIITTMANNAVPYLYYRRKYSYINTAVKMDSTEKSILIKNVKSIFVYKVSSNILTGTDNIIIAVMVGTALIGKCSNHVMILSIASIFLQTIFENIMASIGNLNVSGSAENRLSVLYESHFFAHWIFSLACAMMALFINPVVVILFGKQFELEMSIVFALVLNVYLIGINIIPSTYRTTMGLFNEAKIIPLAAAIINIIFSIALAIPFGVFGIFIATCLSRVITFNIFDTYFVFKNGFSGKSPLKLYCRTTLYILQFLLMYITVKMVLSLIPIDGIAGLAVQMVVAFVFCNVLIIVAFYKTAPFKSLVNRLKNLLLNKGR